MVREELVLQPGNWTNIGSGVFIFRCYISGDYFKIIADKDAQKLLKSDDWRCAEVILIEHYENDFRGFIEVHENVADKGPLLKILKKCSECLKNQYERLQLSYQTDEETKKCVADLYKLIFGKGEEKDEYSGND